RPICSRSPRAPASELCTPSGGSRSGPSGILREPTLRLAVAIDADVPAALEDDLEVASIDRLIRPPAIDDAPLFAHERHLLSVHDPRRPPRPRLHESGARRIQSSRGTTSARASGTRDQGATSTTAQTEPVPVLARTCRSPSRRRTTVSSPA